MDLCAVAASIAPRRVIACNALPIWSAHPGHSPSGAAQRRTRRALRAFLRRPWGRFIGQRACASICARTVSICRMGSAWSAPSPWSVRVDSNLRIARCLVIPHALHALRQGCQDRSHGWRRAVISTAILDTIPTDQRVCGAGRIRALLVRMPWDARHMQTHSVLAASPLLEVRSNGWRAVSFAVQRVITWMGAWFVWGVHRLCVVGRGCMSRRVRPRKIRRA